MARCALTAFLAVYREGAETALMYQAMIGSQGRSRAGLMGLAAGLGVGLVVLARSRSGDPRHERPAAARGPSSSSGRGPVRMAVVFAGNGVFELQESGLLKDHAA